MPVRTGPAPGLVIRCQCGDPILTVPAGFRLAMKGEQPEHRNRVKCGGCKTETDIPLVSED